MFKIAMVAGEPSGDALGAQLITNLKTHFPHAQFAGIGGKFMQQAGFHSLFDMERLSVMGLVEIIKHLPDLLRLRRELLQYFLKHPPDLFIGIDAPEFNLNIELKLRAAGIPVIHYVSPSVWAWRQNRVKKIAKAVDLMLTLFPFEVEFYKKYDIPVKFVGHPEAKTIPLKIDVEEARQNLGLEKEASYIALLPGSRKQEIHYLGPAYLAAAKLLYAKNKQLRFITTHINEQRSQEFYNLYQKIAPEIPLQFFMQQSHPVIAAADVVVVTSGTCTLETMLYKKPMVIAYKMSSFTYWLAKYLVKISYIGLPNLLANKLLVPELIQHQVTAENIADEVRKFLSDKQKILDLQREFIRLHLTLRGPPFEEIIADIKQVAPNIN